MSKTQSDVPDKIFYINLDRRLDRDQNVQQLLNKFGVQNIAERISAVDGSKLDLDEVSLKNTVLRNIISKQGIIDAKDKTKKTGIPLTPGGIGCAMSHRSAWKRIIDQNLESALILEDDIHIDQNFHQKLHQYMRLAKPLMYDVLFIGYHPATIKYISPRSVNDVFVKSPRTYGLFGYVVSKKGAEKLLKIFPIDLQIDTAISEAIGPHKLNIYLVKPEHRIITSDPSEVAKEFGTDIQKRENFESNHTSTYMSTLDSPDAFFYHMIWFLTAIVGLYLVGMFSGLMDQSKKSE